MIDPQTYGVEVRRRTLDGETLFEARVRELPDVAEYADTAEEAYALALDTIQTTAQIFADKGRTMPAVMQVADEWSGRVTLRLPRSLHRALAQAAESEGCSLNQHLVNVLSYFAGYASGMRDSGSHWQVAAGEPRQIAAKRSHLRLVSAQDYSEPEEALAWG